MLVNIDNGGTLTDICLIDGDQVSRTKVLTTPHDLSECLFAGLRAISQEAYGLEDVPRLLREADHIRYSTTQGTNALVQRRGPRLGLIVADSTDVDAIRAIEPDLFDHLVGARFVAAGTPATDAERDLAVTAAINRLTAAGAARIVISLGDKEQEEAFERTAFRRFPRQMLGAVPLLPAASLSDDPLIPRRGWSALLNAFLHPAMERFLYLAERRLKAAEARNPLLIFRNDGGASRIAKTVALMTYSSGPRGGMEGVAALARRLDLRHVISFDVGGTTTDIGLVEDFNIRAERHGLVEGVPVSMPLADIVSAGVGGSSIASVVDGKIQVGPQSVGSAPGPAAFGRGGREATITDALLVRGLLDPDTFLNGSLRLDADRAREALDRNIGAPLGIDTDEAADCIIKAWTQTVANAIAAYTPLRPETVLMAFGGGGPLLATMVADILGAREIILPAMAPVFSAYGIGFSEVSQTYRRHLTPRSRTDIEAEVAAMRARAERDMFGEGAALDQCELKLTLIANDRQLDCGVPDLEGAEAFVGAPVEVQLRVTRPTPIIRTGHAKAGAYRPAVAAGTRRTQLQDADSLPLYQLEDMAPGMRAEGPAVLEDAFATAFVGRGWTASILPDGDVRLQREI